MRRWATLAAAVIVAMAVGRLITDQIPLGQSAERPFVTSATVGHPVHLRYADLTVLDVRGAAFLDGGSTRVLPGGRFLVADVRMTATDEPTIFEGVYLTDREGRHYEPAVRGGCAGGVHAETGVPSYARYCFDLPASAMRGAHLFLARGDYGVSGSGIRRDAVADVDLGLDRKAADRLATVTTGLRGFQVARTAPHDRAVPR